MTTARELAASRLFLVEEDVDLIQELVGKFSDYPFLKVVDLGAGSGTTALSVLEAREPGSVLVTTVDISQENIDWAELIVKDIDRLDDWESIQGDAAEVASLFEDVDLILLDTSHRYQATVNELYAWLMNMNKYSYIWLHDYVDEVKQAVDEFVVAGRLKPYKIAGLGWSGQCLM